MIPPFHKRNSAFRLESEIFYFTTVLYKQNPNNFKINMNFQLVSMNYSPSELLFILIPNKIIT